MAKKAAAAPPDRVKLFDALIASNAEVERKGATMPYTSVNGNMYSFLDKDGKMALRLPADDREAFIQKYGTHLHESYGAVMKEYVTVPDGLLEKTEELKSYLDMSFEYAKSLKPKPTKKSSK